MAKSDTQVEAVAIDTIRTRERRVIDDACTLYRALAVEIKALQERQKAVIEGAKIAAAELGHERIRGEGYLFSHVVSQRKRIDAKILLKKGVGQKIIDAATVVTETDSWRVTGSKDDDGGEE